RVEPGLRVTFTFAQTSMGEDASCGQKGSLAVFIERDGLLRHGRVRYEQLANGDFVAQGRRIHVLDDGRWEISSELCGDNILIPADAETPERPSPSQ
ncbi:MAG: hypothetical protein KUG77_02960, partial [Nannocystaceae bacterium]|nr:hypothetical protein [Nannocystaceae bacterium]